MNLSFLQKNSFCVIRMLVCLMVLNGLLYNQSLAEDKKITKSVEVFDANGKSMGRLEENKDGNELLLVPTGEKAVSIAGYVDTVKQKETPPRGSNIALVYVRNCGASTDFATRLDVISKNNGIGKNDSNTVFILKGSQSVKVQWADSNTIIVNYPNLQEECIYKQITEYGSLKIEYHKTAEITKKTQYVELSNFNYGLTGINVSGLSEDIILRSAGWAQEKSGMTMKEWGHWYGQPPYGDDPNEQNYIKQGFIWSKQHKGKP